MQQVVMSFPEVEKGVVAKIESSGGRTPAILNS